VRHPVIAFRSGSVPEVIDDGVTGFVVNDEAEAVRAIGRSASLTGTKCAPAWTNGSRQSGWPKSTFDTMSLCWPVLRSPLALPVGPAFWSGFHQIARTMSSNGIGQARAWSTTTLVVSAAPR